MHAASLFRTWDKSNHLEHICIYILIFSTNLLLLLIYDTRIHASYQASFCLTSALKLVKFQIPRFPISWRTVSFIEIGMLLSIDTILSTFAVLAVRFSFFIPYHQVLLIAKDLIFYARISTPPNFKILINVFSTVLYFVVNTHGVAILIHFVLTTFIFAVSIKRASFKQLILFHHKMPANNLSTNIMASLVLSLTRTSHELSQSLTCYSYLRIILQEANAFSYNTMQFETILICILGTCSGYAIIKLYYHLPFILYLFVSLGFPLSSLLY